MIRLCMKTIKTIKNTLCVKQFVTSSLSLCMVWLWMLSIRRMMMIMEKKSDKRRGLKVMATYVICYLRIIIPLSQKPCKSPFWNRITLTEICGVGVLDIESVTGSMCWLSLYLGYTSHHVTSRYFTWRPTFRTRTESTSVNLKRRTF